jgi:hypothetical protein
MNHRLNAREDARTAAWQRRSVLAAARQPACDESLQGIDAQTAQRDKTGATRQ